MAPFRSGVSPIPCWMAPSLLAGVVFLSPTSAAEPEQVSIQTLLSPQVTSYQQHLVTVEGITSALDILPPTLGSYSLHSNPCLLHGRASFVLEDETDSLPIVVLGSCNPGVVEALPKDGDRVRVTGLVQVLKRDAPRNVRVQAAQLQILESH
ncbi:MAG: OB-fold nucleic acid binding domain-containing protein [Nitrospiraceae bacterium]